MSVSASVKGNLYLRQRNETAEHTLGCGRVIKDGNCNSNSHEKIVSIVEMSELKCNSRCEGE